MLLVVPATRSSAYSRSAGVDRLIPNFSILEEALALASAARPTPSSSALTARSEFAPA